ncbi:hypothetical protein GCM10010317_045680 [Streptomyces mirabilis]|jgi:VIT1/CCC1 family predicted Fe2+/Mn2+ transporter|uniref:hypothetical protein n=1 Tax=Streptomyces mirabilis TaxID=68239 RepID=UPI00167D34FA|nr:hypothetical protein [Streptomyces mirabilis]GHD57599.1 hypothetical protein GCM10010317_045680 [Streptomyces mirabilis]
MSSSFAITLLPLIVIVGGLCLTGTVLGIHALLLGRLPGRRLARRVRQPRLWGLGAMLVACLGFGSATLFVIGLGLVALGHTVKPSS